MRYHVVRVEAMAAVQMPEKTGNKATVIDVFQRTLI